MKYTPAPGASIKPHERNGYIRLDWNENPYPPPLNVMTGLLDAVYSGLVRGYPQPDACELKEKIGHYVEISPEYIEITNGADFALDYIVRAFTKHNLVICESKTYGYFKYLQEREDNHLSLVDKSPFTSTLVLFRRALEKTKTARLCYIANPNNPTGVYYDSKEVVWLINKYPEILFIVDEAYIEFAHQPSIVPFVKDLPNLFVVRSFSKAFSMAGLRVGYVVTHPRNIRRINQFRNVKEVGILAQIAGCRAMEDLAFMRSQVDLIVGTRLTTVQRIKDINMRTYNTFTNFFLVEVADPIKLWEHLKERRIYVRLFDDWDEVVRITVGTPEEMDALVEALGEYENPTH